MMNADFIIDVNAKDLCLGRDHGQAHVDPPMGATPVDFRLGLAIRQQPAIQNKIPTKVIPGVEIFF